MAPLDNKRPQSPSKLRLRDAAGAAVILLAVLSFPTAALSQGALLPGETSKQFLITMSGTVGKETFHSARCLLTINPRVVGSLNPYQVIINGYPFTNSRNSFFWFSEDTNMTALAGGITCRLKKTYVKQSSIHFYYMSPALLTPGSFTQANKEQAAQRLKDAKPTRITAQDGVLELNVTGGGVRGKVWMTGYDFIEKAYVRYAAVINGHRTYNMRTESY